MTKIAYEPHPVSAERKAELVAGGFKIIDAKLAPEGATEPSQPKRKRTKKAYSEPVADAE